MYTYQICRAVGYCHGNNICHRDVNPKNFLLDPETHVIKLCDFGDAKILKAGEENTANTCTRHYRAPEIILGNKFYTTSIDLWSIGCVIAEIFLTRPIFPGIRSASSTIRLHQISRILGTPTKQDIVAMNPQSQSQLQADLPIVCICTVFIYTTWF